MAEKEYTVIGIDKHVYYGKCTESAADDQIKEVVIENPTIYIDGQEEFLDLSVGDQLIVTFTNGNTNSAPTLSLHINDSGRDIGLSNNNGRLVIDSNVSLDCNYLWEAGDVISFIYVVEDNNNDGIGDTSYWKVHSIGAASIDKLGLVRIAETLEDLENRDIKTAVSYDLIEDFLNNNLSNLKLSAAPNNEDGKWYDISLTLDDEEEPTITLPKPITATNQLTNNADDGVGKYLKNNSNLGMTSPELGLGYQYFNAGGSPQCLNNFIPMDTAKNGDVKVGYGSLYAYQAGLEDGDNEELASNPTLYLDGKQTYIRVNLDNTEDQEDDSGFIKFQAVDLINNEYEDLATFGIDSIEFHKPTNVTSLSASEITTEDLGADTITANEIIVNGEDVVTIINNKADEVFPIDVIADHTSTQSTFNLFLLQKVRSVKLTAAANTTYRQMVNNKETNNLVLDVPVINGYSPIALGGFNADAATDNDFASLTNIWECYLSADGTKIHYGITNMRAKENSIYFDVRVLYVKDEWGGEQNNG